MLSFSSVRVKSYFKGTMLGTYLRRKRWNRAILSPTGIQKTIDFYMEGAEKSEKEKVFADIVDMAKKYRFSAEEYFYYHFRDKDEEERKTFISDLNRIDFCETLNKFKNLHIFDDKMTSAEVFGKYYGRDLCGVKSAKDIDKFKSFVKKHDKFILKPLTGTCGRGIQVLTISPDDTDTISNLVNQYCAGAEDGFIAEELVVQVPELSKFHPSSLNTIRIATVRYEDGVEVIASFFRMGRGGNIVDNAGAGGVFGTIDIETGVVNAVGDEYGNNYVVHPDTNEQILGFKIPRWEEAVEIAKELAGIVKGNRYAGWDLALTENGWVMIEGNARGQFVWQIPLQKGFLADANAILRRLGLKEIKKLGI